MNMTVFASHTIKATEILFYRILKLNLCAHLTVINDNISALRPMWSVDKIRIFCSVGAILTWQIRLEEYVVYSPPFTSFCSSQIQKVRGFEKQGGTGSCVVYGYREIEFKKYRNVFFRLHWSPVRGKRSIEMNLTCDLQIVLIKNAVHRAYIT